MDDKGILTGSTETNADKLYKHITRVLGNYKEKDYTMLKGLDFCDYKNGHLYEFDKKNKPRVKYYYDKNGFWDGITVGDSEVEEN